MKPLHVLLVEAGEDLRDALSDALRDSGYDVTAAASARVAVRASLRAPVGRVPDVCVIDAHDDGEILEELASDRERYGRVAVVALSFGTDPLPGADVDLRRPYELSDLEEAIGEAFGKRHPLDVRDQEGPPGP